MAVLILALAAGGRSAAGGQVGRGSLASESAGEALGGASIDHRLADSRQHPLVTSLAVTPTGTLLVGTGAGVLTSSDQGKTWTRVGGRGLPDRPVSAVAVDPENAHTLYVAVRTSGALYKSTNAGIDWHRLRGPNPRVGLTAVAVDPKDPATVYVGTDFGCTGCDVTGLFKSTNGGRTWQAAAAYVDGGCPAVAIDPINPQHVYASDGGFTVSTDGGKSWRSHGPNGVNALAIDPGNGQTVYAGTFAGVFKSTSGGRSWSVARKGLPRGANVNALVADPHKSSVVIASASGRLFKTTDAGVTWKPLN
jgi:photosystem II stability/assembly factor-like uncharacterized protein